GLGADIHACHHPASSSDVRGDCHASTTRLSSDLQEVGNGADDDCDGLTDDADPSILASSQGTYYHDGDGDGYGAGAEIHACNQPASSSTVSGDCDDTNPAINPAAQEVCNGADDDCEGGRDAGGASILASSQGMYYQDGDGDGYVAGAAVHELNQPVSSSTGCVYCEDT